MPDSKHLKGGPISLTTALVVFGPDKLTGTARELGRFVSETRRSVEEFKAELVSEEEPHGKREPEQAKRHLE
jgi:Sec-independent protein translocase protein TatA